MKRKKRFWKETPIGELNEKNQELITRCDKCSEIWYISFTGEGMKEYQATGKYICPNCRTSSWFAHPQPEAKRV